MIAYIVVKVYKLKNERKKNDSYLLYPTYEIRYSVKDKKV